jgi:3-hydroxyisobutyrate dehydrogenase
MAAIGVVGIGRMGWAMAGHLAGHHDVAVYDVQPGLAERFAREVGGTASGDLAGLAARSEIVVTMLPNSAIVETALFGPGDSLAAGLRAGAIVLEMSSGAPAKTVALAARLREAGVDLVDAPVSGGVSRAVKGELAIMVGIDDDALFARCEPVLRTMGTTIMRTGGVGSGHAMKALNNLVSAGGFLIGIEALLMGAKFGLDPKTMIDVLNASTGMNNSTKTKFSQFVLSRSFGSGFALDLMVKDLTNALELGRQNGAVTPFAALCRELWAAASAELGPGEDHTAIAKVAERLAGVELGAAA